jgi:hypothetical protein
MASTAFPAVVAAVFAVASASSSVRVIRGRDVSGDPGDVVMIGVRDPDNSFGWDSTGEFEQEFQSFGGNRRETGVVNGLALSRNGSGDIDAACQAVCELVVDLEAAVRATPALGVTTLEYLVTQFQAGQVQESASAEGAAAVQAFVVHYEARI